MGKAVADVAFRDGSLSVTDVCFEVVRIRVANHREEQGKTSTMREYEGICFVIIKCSQYQRTLPAMSTNN